MEKFIKGDIVVIPFPFSNLSQIKRRPALVVAALHGDDVILCQITSQLVSDRYSLQLSETDFQTGALRQISHIRPNRLFTAEHTLILYRVGHLKPEKIQEVNAEIRDLFQ